MSTSGRDTPHAVPLVVIGAHMTGMPLNGELQVLGATFLRNCRTAPSYRIYELPEGQLPKPGLLRVGPDAGVSVEVEIWSLNAAAFGIFVSRVPEPLTIGTVRLIDGSEEKGFLVEEIAVRQARDISEFGGWRGYKLALKPVDHLPQ
jgi:allophanate hydrolase